MSRPGQQVLAVVEHQQQAPVAPSRAGARARSSGRFAHRQPGRDASATRRASIRGARSTNQTPSACRARTLGELEREPCLARPADAGEREQPRLARSRDAPASSASRPTNRVRTRAAGCLGRLTRCRSARLPPPPPAPALPKLGPPRVAIRRILGQALGEHDRQARRQRRATLVDRARLGRQVLAHELGRGGGDERRLAGEHLVEHARERVDVRRASTSPPLTCSGLMYAACRASPHAGGELGRRSRVPVGPRCAMPKSATSAMPSASSMFSGLMSRCMTPCWCA